MTLPSYHASAQAGYEPAPSRMKSALPALRAAERIPDDVGSVGVPVSEDGEVPTGFGLDRAALRAAGFEGKVGQTVVVPRAGGPTWVAVGVGERAKIDAAVLRDATATFARASGRHARIAVLLPDTASVLRLDAGAQAVAEGAVLARYRYRPFRHPENEQPLEALTVVGAAAAIDEIEDGLRRAEATTRAVELARDLANAPGTLLTARKMAEIAQAVAADTGLAIEIFDEEKLLELGCGGILGVNAGSQEPPRMIKLTYTPKPRATGTSVEPPSRVALIGKGIMYDSGGISLKPNDLVHATMKADMSGAAAILGAMSTLSALGCECEVTGYLMCTDNMPSGSAMKLGDVLTIRGGKTVEVLNTDAEGRLVMADGLVLATEQKPQPDAIVDIATLTGACQRALGRQRAGVLGNDQALVSQVIAAADRTDERVWQLPLERRYRKELDSAIADLKNVGGDDAGAITAALFLEEFVADLPWAHLDIAGTAMKGDGDETFRSKGATGFGTRLLIDFLMNFAPPRATRH